MKPKACVTEAAAGWQPIETAPKDSRVLVWAAGAVRIGRFDDDEYSKKPRPMWSWVGPWCRADMRASPPSHWMPLPGAPK